MVNGEPRACERMLDLRAENAVTPMFDLSHIGPHSDHDRNHDPATPLKTSSINSLPTMSQTPGPTKLPRTMPFTPKRPLSAMSGSSDSSSSTIRPNTVAPASGLPSAKKYKAALSSDARPRSAMKIRPPSVLSVVPGSPSSGRPKTPTTPRLGRESPGLGLEMPSEMDVSRVDPEEVLVDYQNMDVGDISIEVDETGGEVIDHGSQDKVQVSIRYVHSTSLAKRLILTRVIVSDRQIRPAHGIRRCADGIR